MSRRTALYRFFDEANMLLYVGITENPVARFSHHRSSKAWWAEVERHTIDWFETRDQAMTAELIAIASERPRWNVVGSPCPPERPVAPWLRAAMAAGLTHSITEAKQRFSALVESVCEARQPAFLLAYGKPQAAIVPVELAEAVRDLGGPDVATQILRDHMAQPRS